MVKWPNCVLAWETKLVNLVIWTHLTSGICAAGDAVIGLLRTLIREFSEAVAVSLYSASYTSANMWAYMYVYM